MFGYHARDELSAYCNDELSPGDAQRVAEHLLVCASCREAYEAIRLGVGLAAQLPRARAPEDLWPEIERALKVKAKPRLIGWRPLALAASLLVAMSVAAVSLLWSGGPRTSWGVRSLSGSPVVGASTLTEEGAIAVGESLVTDSSSSAQIDVANIGTVDVGPDSRVRLVRTGPTEHRLALDRGQLSAWVYAPPRLFVIDTPSAAAVDYGCAYTLTVNDEGATFLHVTSGWVALILNGRESMVPRGAMCETRPGIGPGTPYFDDSTPSFRESLRQVDFGEGNEAALDALLAEARQRDALTVFHLVPRVDESRRRRVVDRLAELVPPPLGVTREALLALDEAALESWGDLVGAR